MADKSQTDDKQPERGPGAAQDPYPVDPSNELLDGDNIPSAEELSEANVKVAESGRALLHEDAPETPEGAVYIPPPQSANLERKKALEKHMAAAAESVGEFSVQGETARAEAAAKRRAEATEQVRSEQAQQTADAEKARADAEQSEADAKAKAEAQARKTPPSGRTSKQGTQSKG